MWLITCQAVGSRQAQEWWGAGVGLCCPSPPGLPHPGSSSTPSSEQTHTRSPQAGAVWPLRERRGRVQCFPPAKPHGRASSGRPPSAGRDPRRIFFLPPFQIKKTIHFISLIFQMEANWPCWQVPDGCSLPPCREDGAQPPSSSSSCTGPTPSMAAWDTGTTGSRHGVPQWVTQY